MKTAKQENLAVVLVDTRNPLNIGAVARAMSNFGFFDLRLVSPYDLAFREAVSAVGASDLLQSAKVFSSVAEAVAGCSLVVGATGLGHRQPQHPLHRLEKAGRLLKRHLSLERVALLFGSEKFGLSNEDVSHCHWLLRIPTRREHESMNLAQAVAVCLYEFVRQPATARQLPERSGMAGSEELERITLLLKEILELAGYTSFDTLKTAGEKVRRLVRRLHVPAEEANVLTGMLRQVLWKLRNP